MNKRRRFKAKRRRAADRAMRRRFVAFWRDRVADYGKLLPKAMHRDVLGEAPRW